jgi:hypothetical protein
VGVDGGFGGRDVMRGAGPSHATRSRSPATVPADQRRATTVKPLRRRKKKAASSPSMPVIR